MSGAAAETAGAAPLGTAPPAPPRLEVRDLSLRFGGINALTGVSLEVEPGQLVAIIGPNGAGKTSLFNCLTGYYRPTAGRVNYGGKDITHMSPPDVATLGIRRTFQNIRLFPQLSALENVLAGAHVRSRANVVAALVRGPGFRRHERFLAQEAERWLDFVGLSRYRSVQAGDLAYGVRKRIEVARALIGQPTLMLLDEPAAGVSSVERAELSELILRVAAQGISVVMIEHDVELVMRLASRVTVLDRGQVIAAGPPAQVREDEAVVAAYIGRRR
jgi:branched-chain amino acid transport system ATP-binding protein